MKIVIHLLCHIAQISQVLTRSTPFWRGLAYSIVLGEDDVTGDAFKELNYLSGDSTDARGRSVQSHAQTPWYASYHLDHMWVSLLYFCLVQGEAAEMKFLAPEEAQKFGKDGSRDFLKQDI